MISDAGTIFHYQDIQRVVTPAPTFLITAASGCSSLGSTCHSRFFHLATVVK
jgi:hypothetical protein